jgi:hypothetical protein
VPRLAATILLLSCTLAGGAASAAPKHPKQPPPQAAPSNSGAADIDTAEQLYAKLDFEEANKVAERAIRQRGLPHDTLVRATRILAITHAVLDHEEEARNAFVALLFYEPEYEIDPKLGPKVTTPFFEARGLWRAQPQRPGLEAVPVLHAGEAGTLRVTTRDPTQMVAKVIVGFRWGASGELQTSTTSPGDSVPVELPEPPQGKTRLDYYVQAIDDRDRVLMEIGTPQAPKTALVDTTGTAGGGALTKGGAKEGAKEGEGSSIFASPVFWGAAAAVVVAGSVTAFLLTRPKDPAPPTSAALAPAVNCGIGSKCQ